MKWKRVAQHILMSDCCWPCFVLLCSTSPLTLRAECERHQSFQDSRFQSSSQDIPEQRFAVRGQRKRHSGRRREQSQDGAGVVWLRPSRTGAPPPMRLSWFIWCWMKLDVLTNQNVPSADYSEKVCQACWCPRGLEGDAGDDARHHAHRWARRKCEWMVSFQSLPRRVTDSELSGGLEAG